MPNHVTNCVTVIGAKADLDKMIAAIHGEDTEFDFNKIIPMPDNIFRGDVGAEEKKLYGKNNWYDWSIDNWGTKWNSYDCDVNRVNDNQVVYEFCTAWDAPIPVIKKLSTLFNIQVEDKFYDEDLGHNCGKIMFNSIGDCICDEYILDNGLDFIAKNFGASMLEDHGIIYQNNQWRYIN